MERVRVCPAQTHHCSRHSVPLMGLSVHGHLLFRCARVCARLIWLISRRMLHPMHTLCQNKSREKVSAQLSPRSLHMSSLLIRVLPP
jgi:hypothetical protein